MTALDQKAMPVTYHPGHVDASHTLKVRDVTGVRLEHLIWMPETKTDVNRVLVMVMVRGAFQLKDSLPQTLLPTLQVCTRYAEA